MGSPACCDFYFIFKILGNRSRVDDRDHPYMRSGFLGHIPGQMPPSSMHMTGSPDIRVPEMTCHSGEQLCA